MTHTDHSCRTSFRTYYEREVDARTGLAAACRLSSTLADGAHG